MTKKIASAFLATAFVFGMSVAHAEDAVKADSAPETTEVKAQKNWAKQVEKAEKKSHQSHSHAKAHLKAEKKIDGEVVKGDPAAGEPATLVVPKE
ncbi:hypothetical protein [Burkholderia cepacia]|uniref:hypothetical protein n=1 Tax=Burkholderia cepacia TaxID=292 RepID=UPI001CF58750|nr:hypothetical protein [Burkholderia cepacia]MCA8354199.1 hypothetical protein [Burkholderia cepacia]